MLPSLVAQVADTGAVDIGAALVSYGVAAPFVGWLIWQLRSDRKTYADEAAAHRTQLDAERQANRELYDRIIAQQERMAPILEHAAGALDQAARALDRAMERR